MGVSTHAQLRPGQRSAAPSVRDEQQRDADVQHGALPKAHGQRLDGGALVALHVRNVLEKRDDDREDGHEGAGKQQRERHGSLAAVQAMHVRVSACNASLRARRCQGDWALLRTGAGRLSSCGSRSRTARQARARRRCRRRPRTASASSASAARRRSKTSQAPGCGCHRWESAKQREHRRRGATAGCITHQNTSVAISGGELATYPAAR